MAPSGSLVRPGSGRPWSSTRARRRWSSLGPPSVTGCRITCPGEGAGAGAGSGASPWSTTRA
ncbi:hypothetical protein, partial [Streptomyces sp. MBT55]|uniref:hypothetical protein n=1 Tax=Streptomyces sp. MBT55 TaxID=1488386 RepID=UPI001F3EC170